MSWSSIVGQDQVKRILRASIERGRVAHAYLFTGPEGVGKDAMAIELAKVLNCERGRSEACDTCSSCQKIHILQHPNVPLVFALPVGKNEKYGDPPLEKLGDEEIAFIQEQLRLKAENTYHEIIISKAKNIKINSIREIRRESVLTSYSKGKKVFIIIEAEKMSDDAANALLKTLEEPHEDTVLILTTSYPDRLLPTIVSRCQYIQFSYLREDELCHALQERDNLPVNQAQDIARLANGNYARALQWIYSSLQVHRNEAVEFLRTVLHRSRAELLREIERIVAEYEKQELEQFLSLLQGWIRDAMIVQEGKSDTVNVDETNAIRKFVAHYSHLDYSQAIAVVDRAISLLSKNVYIPLVLLNLAIDLRRIIFSSTQKEDVITSFNL
ncbi:MAG: DNA polymerase III subunit delta' [Ignavibacteriae bacterium]|nr:DNA polymerase III subunit delta' [Ignavibacteriota bacterium]